MKRYCLPVLLAFYFAFATGVPAESPKVGVFPESLLIDAFEKGCSLIVAEILSVHEEQPTKFYFYKVKVIRPIILGDLTKNDIQDPLELFAGASYGDALKPGFIYALFVIKECPYHSSWAHRDEVLQIDTSDSQSLDRLVRAANRAYSKTVIHKFRQGWQAVQEVELPLLPEETLSLCKQFKTDPESRAEIGKKIFESDLGSRHADSRPYSSEISYLPPKVSLSREQILSLLGSPNLKSGWTYFWLCGQIGKGTGAKEVDVLSATFDKRETAVRVLYQRQEKSKWTKFTAYSINPYVSVCGQADIALYRFQRALKEHNWERALSCCSRPVKVKAKEFNSAKAFFKDYIPVAQITGLSEFRVRGHSARADKLTRLSFEIPLEVPEAKWPVRWEWSLIWDTDRWLVDFKTLPVKILVRKELLRRELEDEDGRVRMEKIKKGIEFNLIPITKEFVIGQPMLFRIEMINVSNSPILYTATGPTAVMANDKMIITGPDGERVEYVDTSYQILVYSDVILPDEKIVLVDKYDATTQYRIVEPNRYTFQFKGWPRDVKLSNTVQVDVKHGALSPEDRVVEKLLNVLPEGWECTRTLVKKEGDENPFSETFIGVHLIGARRGKSNGLGVLLLIFLAEDEIELEPEFASELEFWGRCKWGPVYVKVNDAKLLWPDYKEQIIKALAIKQTKPN